MIPLGYMAKKVMARPDWLKAVAVDEVLSVSSCMSANFASFLEYWKHNNHWFFDSPSVIRELAKEHSLDLVGCRLFYYEAYELAYDEEARAWVPYDAWTELETDVQTPVGAVLRGYDVVTYSCGNSAECSPLSCNGLASGIATNRYCLLDSMELAKQLIDEQKFSPSEPGPFRILAVYEVLDT